MIKPIHLILIYFSVPLVFYFQYVNRIAIHDQSRFTIYHFVDWLVPHSVSL